MLLATFAATTENWAPLSGTCAPTRVWLALVALAIGLASRYHWKVIGGLPTVAATVKVAGWVSLTVRFWG